MTDKLGEAAFTTSGFNNWKNALQRFEQHSQSRIHKEAMLKIEMLKKPSIGAQLSSQVKKKTEDLKGNATNNAFFTEVLT